MIKKRSAGGIVINESGKILIVSQNSDSWSLPKGHLDDDETELDAAIREIREESGLKKLKFIKKLGTYERFQIGKNGKGENKNELKIITLFLFKTNEFDLQPEDEHNPEAQWIAPEKVAAFLTHPKDKLYYLEFAKLSGIL